MPATTSSSPSCPLAFMDAAAADNQNFWDFLAPTTGVSVQTNSNNLARLDALVDKAFAGDASVLPKVEEILNGIYAALSTKSSPSVMDSVGAAITAFPKDLASLVGSMAGSLIKSTELELPTTGKIWGIAAATIGIVAILYYVNK